MTYQGTLRDYTPQTDIWVMALIFLSFLLLMLLLGHQRRYIAGMARKVFLPSNKVEKPGQKSVGEQFLPFFSAVVLACADGLMAFAYLHSVCDLQHTAIHVPLILLSCVLVAAFYLLLRHGFYCFVNWVFFDPQLRQQWKGGNSLLWVIETTVFYALMVVGIFSGIRLETMTILVIISYVLLRLAFVPHTKRMFFPTFYGYLHLIAYLCALEIAPLLVLWQIAGLRTLI